MKYLIVSLFFLGLGCAPSSNVIPSSTLRSESTSSLRLEETTVDSGGGISSPPGDSSVDGELLRDDKDSEVDRFALPIDGQLLYKGFGEYFEDRFTGYHVAIDLEAPADTPVYAVEEGEVTYSGWVSGYGGVMVVKTIMSGRTQSYIYGHLDPASMRTLGETVGEGEQLAILGEEGEETDGEREHLHFAMYEGGEVRLRGYETNASALGEWLNPTDYVRSANEASEQLCPIGQNCSERVLPISAEQSEVISDKMSRAASELIYGGQEVFALEFDVPAGWDVEYIPSIQSLNLYSLSGEGTARERSQILIRYFDASSFLTLSTVTIHSTRDMSVGTGNYTARRYDIEKNTGIADFVDQPSWRNERHIVTDFRGVDGYTRYYVVAANPSLDVTVYESLLASMMIQ